ncbi:MAG: lysophospholipid acyltransferase family protein [Maritimibacter sp.]
MSAARDISYAHSAQSRGGKALIRVMENSTGRLGLIKRANGYQKAVAQGACFWREMTDRFGVTLDLAPGALGNIPATGPLILVANHPFGILDGLIMGRILAETRADFHILAHQVFRKAPDLERVILPVSFDNTPEALRTNIDTRRAALGHLSVGGAIGIFPGGTVSTPARPFGAAMDPQWRRFTARMVVKSRAQVVPVCFEGANSRLFQVASHVHPTLRMGLLIREFKKRIDKPVRLQIGAPLSPETLRQYANDPKSMMDFLRQSTYALSPTAFDPALMGHEFEEKHKTRPEIEPGAEGLVRYGSRDFR